MKNYILKSSFILFAFVGIFFIITQEAHAVPCTLESVSPDGATAIYDCGEYGKVTVAKGATVTPGYFYI